MDLNFAVFQEPRGVMRILHLIFSIAAFASLCEYSGSVSFKVSNTTSTSTYVYKYDYPFNLLFNATGDKFVPPIQSNCSVAISGSFANDARYFVATGVLAMLFSISIIFVYAKFDNLYKSSNRVQLSDFFLTVVFSVLWLSSSAAWANGLSGLKSITDPGNIKCSICTCVIHTSGFSSLNVSMVLGFLNFFLWAADLWFVYKETSWFHNNQGTTTSGV